jgi:hypothetical protein
MTTIALPNPWNSIEATPEQCRLMHQLHADEQRSIAAGQHYQAVAVATGSTPQQKRDAYDAYRYSLDANHPANFW